MVFNILLMQRALDLGHEKLSKFDVICSHDWLTAPAAQALSNTFGSAHIVTFHDTIVGKRLGRIDGDADRFSAYVEHWTANTATHVIANSTATKTELVQTYGARPDRISIVPCAIDPGSFRVAEDNNRLADFRQSMFPGCKFLALYVGRLDPEKGVDILIEAFAKAQLLDARLL